MSYLMIMYYCVAGISALFFTYSLYLIFKVSTPQMVPYIYYLLTIQVCAFLESLYWTVLMAPIIKLPIFGIELGVSVFYGFSTVLHCLVDCAFAWAFLYRYRLCLFNSRWDFSAKKEYTIMAVNCAITVFGSTPASIWAFKGNEESRREAFAINSSLIFDESFVISGGPTTLLWLGFLLVASSAALIALTIIIKHVSNILKDHAKFSQTSRDMHRSAISGLIIQGVAVMSSVVVPMCMLCHILLLPPSSTTFTSHYATCATLLFSLKSFNASLSMIFTTKPYRKHFAAITGVNYMLSRYFNSNIVIKSKEPTLVSSSAVLSTN
ncbi:unnamed protein product [Cylicocyclus nassatus]|uniref:G protein-coupled receptor n=1 Tax=Cylicocyclus nassatus TaxID=53992 RepID=A0AA36GYZ8_CYLNA|nr:unnamed protein product [Cylicocyclus nassatus]